MPIIATATMGAADQRHFDALRAAHFPPERNHLAAHITLFHQLPPSCLDELDRLFRRIAADTPPPAAMLREIRSEEHTSELQSLMRISYAVFCLKKKKNTTNSSTVNQSHYIK